MAVNRVRTGLLVACAVILLPAALAWTPMEAAWQGGFERWVTMLEVVLAVCAVAAGIALVRPTARRLGLGLLSGAVLSALMIVAALIGSVLVSMGG